MDELRRSAVYALYTALRGLEYLKVRIETQRDLRLFNRCLDAFTRNYAASAGAPLTQTPLRLVRDIEWRHPHFLTYRERAHMEDGVRGYAMTINKTERRYSPDEGEERLENLADTPDVLRTLSLCTHSEHGLPATPATLRLLEELPLNPAQVLWACYLEPLRRETFLGRDAIRVRAYPKCPALMGAAFSYDVLHLGDYQTMVVDAQLGVLLERRIFLDGEVAETERITHLDAH